MPRMTKRARELILAVVVFILITAINIGVSLLCARTGAGILAVIAPELAMLAVVLAAARLMRSPVRECFPLRPPSARKFLPSVSFALGVQLIASALSVILSAVIPGFSNSADDALFANYVSGVNPVIAVLAVAVVPAICEEMIFRGYLQSRLRAGFAAPAAALLISAAFFSAAHLDLYKALPAFAVGFAYAFIAYKTGSIAFTVILHMANNALSLIYAYGAGGGRGASAAEAISASPKTYVLAAAVYIVVGAFFVLLGLKFLGVIKLAGWKLGVIGGAAAVCAATVMTIAAFSAIDVVFAENAVCSYPTGPADGKYEAGFTLESDGECVITLQAYAGHGIEAHFYLTAPDGGTVELTQGVDPSFNDTRELAAGTYVLHCDVAPAPGNQSSEFKYVVISKIVSVAGSTSADGVITGICAFLP